MAPAAFRGKRKAVEMGLRQAGYPEHVSFLVLLCSQQCFSDQCSCTRFAAIWASVSVVAACLQCRVACGCVIYVMSDVYMC